MDIFLGGKGFSFKIAASTPRTADRQHFFKCDHVSVTIHNLNIKLKKSKYKMLFKVFKPMLFSIVRPSIRKALEKQIRDAFEQADGFLYDVHREAKRVKETSKEHPENAPSLHSRYIEAFQARLLQSREKAEAVAKRDTQMSLATTQHDAIFKDIKLDGTITSKATEYKELANQGDRWESPVFSIGSAAETKDIPRLAPVQRKAHATAENSLREGTTTNVDSDYNPNGVNKPVIDQPWQATSADAPMVQAS
jgi:hypothetical protein